MNKYEIVKRIEEFAPLDTQESWDASGWIVDLPNPEVNKVLFALTITPQTIEQAVQHGCDMIISHHPLFYVPYNYKKINMYCSHTNFDKANGGTTDILLNTLHLNSRVYNDFVRIVDLENETSVEFMKLKLLPVSPHLRIVNNYHEKTIRTVAFCAGSGSEFIDETPCDAFVTGDLKYHTAVETNKVVYDIGHFESEVLAIPFLKELSGVGEKGIIANEESPFN